MNFEAEKVPIYACSFCGFTIQDGYMKFFFPTILAAQYTAKNMKDSGFI